MQGEELKLSFVPEDANVPLDLSHNPFAPQPPKAISESQLIFAKASEYPGNDDTNRQATTFVEIESYEKLRARADILTETLAKVQKSLTDKDLVCQQTEEEVQAASRTICGLRRDVRELVDRIEKQQSEMEELSLER